MKTRLGLAFIAATLASISLASLAQAQENNGRPLRIRVIPAAVASPEPSPTPSPTPTPTASPAPTLRVFRMPATTAASNPAPTPPPAVRPATTIQLSRPAITALAGLGRTEITPPATVRSQPRAGAIILRGGSNSSTIRALNVRRQVNLLQMRATPRFAIGRATADLTPVLANPRALFNVAQSLRRQSNLADVIAEDTRAYEVDQGLIVHSFLTYRLKPGACSDGARRAMLVRTGTPCVKRMGDGERQAAFANPADPRFVKDPQQRAALLAKAQVETQKAMAEMASDLAKLRSMLNDPAQHAAIDAERGPGEAARLALLNDDDLQAEVINAGEVAIEQNAFVPLILPANLDKKDEPAPPAVIDVETPLTPRIFVTGFTLAGNYEWHQRIEKTINRCLVGCKKTYYAEASAGLGYGFGMRFPIQLTGLYSYHEDGGSKAAKVRVNFQPFNGSDQSYRDAGMPEPKVFNGKELVAQVDAFARFSADLPTIPDIDVGAHPFIDFTNFLPGDLKGGNFAPPAPGAPNPPEFVKFFEDIDLLGNNANLGIVGAKVFPGIRIQLVSGGLNFAVQDLDAGTPPVTINDNQSVDLMIGKANTSHFIIGDPVYNLGINVTPGVEARLWIDLGLWSHDWDFPIWLPQLSIQVPAGGVNFSCHAETVCSRYYAYSPTSHEEDEADVGKFKFAAQQWRDAFVADKSPECADETCRIGIRFVGQGYFYGAMHRWDANHSLSIDGAELVQYLSGANAEAKTLVNESQARQTVNAANSFGTFWTAWWSKQCADKICLDKIKPIVFLEKLEVVSYQKQHPDASTNEAIGTVGKKFAPVFEAEVKASKDRVAAEEAAEAARESARKVKAGRPFTPIRIKTMPRTN